jgi:hypothetical protein
MEKNVEKAVNNFLSDEKEQKFEEKVKADKKKFIKSDFTLIERIDKVIISEEDGRQLLREVY